MRWSHEANTSSSSGGMPSIVAISRTGMCLAYSADASQLPWSTKASISDTQSFRMVSSHRATACGVNDGRRSRRKAVCSGGSSWIGGRTTKSPNISLGTEVYRDEKTSVFLHTASTSA
jgi:hypothetical protein